MHACIHVYTMWFPKIEDRKENSEMLKSQREIHLSSFFLNKPKKQSTKPSISFSKKNLDLILADNKHGLGAE